MIILSQNEMFFILLMDIGSGKREKENARTCAETRDACQKTSDEAEASQRRRGRSPASLEKHHPKRVPRDKLRQCSGTRGVGNKQNYSTLIFITVLLPGLRKYYVF